MPETIRHATKQDIQLIEQFLQRAVVGKTNVKEAIDRFIIMENDRGELLATISFQPCGEDALLRSLVMSSDATQQGIIHLFSAMVEFIHSKNMRDIYLVTSTGSAIPFFKLFHFAEVESSDVAVDIKEKIKVEGSSTGDIFYYMKYSV